ncbi:MAG: UbiX family flavin prenyltransferase [Bacteroidales bacterium]|jgi:4-hydroxy-3-polyprenylbenzoate decarboxylase|nr:UbiX family flavin prenyltransferase [Bacteroidales bacterium]
MNKQKIIVAITGASGSIYAKILLDKLLLLTDRLEEVGVILSKNAEDIWQHELENQSYQSYPFTRYPVNDFYAPFASGSAYYQTMIVCPCSMGTLGRIAHGISDDLITRAADVTLKEKRKLILVPRETPYNLIHIRNMEQVTLAGGIICPATPSFYTKPQSLQELAATVIDRVLDLAGFSLDAPRWGEK